MPAGFLRYVSISFFLSILCASIAGTLASKGILNLNPTFRYLPLAFFFVLSCTLHFFLIRSIEGRPQRFVTAFMGVQALKMFVHLFIMLIVGFLFPKIAVHFIILYAVYYLAFTLVETISLMRLFLKK